MKDDATPSMDARDIEIELAECLQELQLQTPVPSPRKRGRPLARLHKGKSSSKKNVISEESQDISFFTGVKEASNSSNPSGSHAAEKENQDPALDMNREYFENLAIIFKGENDDFLMKFGEF